MADQITELYNKAREKGVLANGLTEDMFRKQTSTDEGLQSFYNYATSHGMKLRPWDAFRVKARGEEAPMQPAQPVQPASQAEQPLNPSVKEHPAPTTEEEYQAQQRRLDADLGVTNDPNHPFVGPQTTQPIQGRELKMDEVIRPKGYENLTDEQLNEQIAQLSGNVHEQKARELYKARYGKDYVEPEEPKGWWERYFGNKGREYANERQRYAEAVLDASRIEELDNPGAAKRRNEQVATLKQEKAYRDRQVAMPKLGEEIKDLQQRILSNEKQDGNEMRGAKHLLNQTIDLYNAPSKYGRGSGIANWGQGLADQITDYDTWTAGVTELVRYGNLSGIVNKMNKGGYDTLTKEEQLLLETFLMSTAVQDMRSDLSTGYEIGKGAAESIPFMVEMYLTAGAGAAAKRGLVQLAERKVGKAFAEKLARSLGGTAIRDAAGNLVERGATQTVAGKVGKTLAYDFAQTAAMPSTYSNIYKDRVTEILQGDGNYGFMDLARSFTGQMVETGTERWGGRLIDRGMSKMIPIDATALWGKNRLFGHFVENYINSPIGETGEEVIAAGVNTLRSLNPLYYHTDDKSVSSNKRLRGELGEMLTPEGLGKTFLTIIPMSIFGGGANAAMNRMAANAVVRDYGQSRQALQSLLESSGATPEEANRIVNQIEASDSDRAFFDKMNMAYNNLLNKYMMENPNAPIEDVKAYQQQLDQVLGDYTKQAGAYNQMVGDLMEKYEKLSDEEKRTVDSAMEDYMVRAAEEFASKQQPQDRQAQLRQQAAQAAQQEVQGMAHQDGNVYYVGIKGKDDAEGYAVSGALGMVTDKDGMYSTSGRDLVTVKMNDGSVQQVPADELVVRDIPVSADELMQERTEHYFAQYANNDVFHIGDKVYLQKDGQRIVQESSTITGIDDEGVHVESYDEQTGQPQDMVIPHEQAADMLAVADGETEDGIVTFNVPDGPELRLRQVSDGVYETIEPVDGQMFTFTDEDLTEMGATRVGEQQPETQEQPEQPQAPSYPTDENGNPAWDQIEQGQAAQLLYDRYKGNKAKAVAVADDMLKEAEKVQKQAAKQQSHSLNLDERDAENAQYDQMREAANAAVKYWNDVKLSLNQIQTAEEQAAKEAQQQAMMQARAERAKTEEGKVTASTMAERYEAAQKIVGNAGTTTLPDGRELAGHYVLIAPEGVTTSHDATNNFQRSEGYPVTSDGQSINDRDYTNDKEEQQKVAAIAQNFNGNAIKNMPVISDEGLVYNGNGRMMAGQLAARNNTDEAYMQSLAANAAQFGFTPEQVASIPHARVAFQLDERLPYSTQSLAIFNEQETQTQSNTGKAAGYARKLTPQAISEVLAAVDGFNTIDAFFNDPKAPHTLINNLINAGIIAQREKAEMVDGDKLSATGRERLSNILFGTVFDNETIRLMGDDAALKNSILRALPQILDNKSLGEFSLEADINDAIRLLYEVRKAKVPFKSFVSQTVIAEDGQVHTAAENYSPYQLLLAEEMTDGGVDAFRDVLTLYNDEARMAIGGQADIFGNLMNDTELKNLILEKYGKEPTETERPDAGRQADNAPQSTSASNEPAAEVTQEEEQITLTDGRVVTPATITIKDFNLIVGMSPIQRAMFAIAANDAQHPDWDKNSWGRQLTGFANQARSVLFGEMPSEKKDLDKVEALYLQTQQEYVAEPNKTDDYRAAAQDVLREIWKRLHYLNPNKYPGGTGSGLINRLKDAELAVAERETDTNPTEAQKKAENYKQGHVTLWGLPITIENPKGSTRRGKDANGKKWEQVMHNTYGKIRRTEGVDGDHIDVFIGPNLNSERAFVVDQLNQDTGEFDEHKVMLGFDSIAEAQAAYLSNYKKGWRGMGPVTEVTMDEFKKWIDSSHRKTKPFNEYKSVKKEAGQSAEAGTTADNEQLRDELAEELRKYDEGETSPADANLLYDTDDLRTAVADLLTRYDNPALQAALDAIETSVEQQRARGGWIDVEDEEAALVQTVRDIVGDKAKAKSRELTLLEAAQQRQRLAQRDNRGISKMSKEDILAELEQYAEGNLLETTPRMAKRILALAKKYGENLPEPIANMVSNVTLLTNPKKATKKTETKPKEDRQTTEQNRLTTQNRETIETGSSAGQTVVNTEANYAEPVNTIFTDEAYEAAKKRMRARLNRLNMGFDPEMMLDQITIAGYHIERGVRKFADFARIMFKEFGKGIRDYIGPMYNNFRDIPEGKPFRDEMDDYGTVMSSDLDNIEFKATNMPDVTEYEDVNGQKIVITDVNKDRSGQVYYALTITEPSGHQRQTTFSVDDFNKELESKGIYPATSEAQNVEKEQNDEKSSENIWSSQKNFVTLQRKRKIQEYRPKELSKEDAELWDWLEENVDRIVDDYKAAKGNTLDPDVIREAFREKGYDGSNVQQYRLLEGALVEILYDEMLTEALAQGRTKLVFLTGHGGAGKSSATKQREGDTQNEFKKQLQSLKDEAGVLFDAAMSAFDTLSKRLDYAIEKGFNPEDITIIPVYNDAATSFGNTLKRAVEEQEGRVLSIKYFLAGFGKNAGKIAKVIDQYPQITIIPVNNEGNNGGRIETPEQATQWNYEITENDKQEIRKKYEDYVKQGVLTERQIATIQDGLSDLEGAGGRVLPTDQRRGEGNTLSPSEDSLRTSEGDGKTERPESGQDGSVRGSLNIPTDLQGALAYFRASVGKMYAKVMGENDIRTIRIESVGKGEDYRVKITNSRKGIDSVYYPEARDLANILNNGFEEVPPSGGGTPAPSGPNGGKKATFEKGQKVKYKKWDAVVEDVNSNGTYNLSYPNALGINTMLIGIDEADIKPIEQPEKETPDFESPMMKQFRDIKKQYPDAILLFRVGDFYELYSTDATDAAKILGITETRRKDGMSFAGFPFHALDTYLPMLVRAGKRVAICDQLEDPRKTEKPVKRGVTEMLTPGTPYEEQAPKQAEPTQEQPQTVEESATETPTQVVTDTVGEIKESKHTKTGTPIWVIKPMERVGNDEFKVLKRRAKLNNGYYSTFVKGFVFNSENDANRFNNISDEQTTTEQTSADTEAIISTAETAAAEAAAVGESAGEEIKQPAIEKIDAATEQIDDQVASLAGIETKVEEVLELPADATVADIREQAEKRSTRNKQLKKRKEELQQVLDLFADEPINDNENGNTNQDTEGTSGATEEEPAAVGNDGTQSDGRPQTGTAQESFGARDAGVVADGDTGETGGETQPTTATGSQQPRSKRGSKKGTAGGVSAGAVQLDPTIEHGDTRTDDHSLRTPKEKNTPLNTRNYLYPEDAAEIDNMSALERMTANVEALETLRNLMAEGREATPEERAILGKLRGWGGVNVPDNYQAKYNKLSLTPIQKRLVDVIEQLDPNGERKLLDSLRTASLTSYYTPIPIARAMHAVAAAAGYNGNGNMLDPSMGNGVFEGSMPKGMQQSTNIRGVELDWLTGQIAQRLYPDARINITGFQDAHIPQDYYDYVVSNIPFGSLQITDLDWKRNPSPIRKAAQGKIHNYFAVKMIESTRPGGLCVIMTSNAIMDTKGNQIIREYITDNCEVLGAVRLPNNTFKGAGTKVVTDVIYLRKFKNAEDRRQFMERADYWSDIATPFIYTDSKTLEDKNGNPHEVTYSKYYQEHPDNMIGRPFAGGQYSDDAFDLESSLSTEDLAKQIEEIGKRIMSDRKGRFGAITADTTIPKADIKEKIKEEYKGNGHYESSGNIVVQDGKIGKLEAVKEGNGRRFMFEEQKLGNASVAQVTDYINLRTLLKQLIQFQIENEAPHDIDGVRKQMQDAYTAYVKKYGKLQEKKNAFISEDIDGFQVRALEQWKDGKFVGMADIYTKNTIASESNIFDTRDPQEAVLNSLASFGHIYNDYMQAVLGDNFAEQCAGLIFEDPAHQGEYIARDVYLSGDVVTKLEYARQIAEEDKRFQPNVDALESVQPKRKEYGEFPCHMGARWIPVQIYNDFLNDIFGIQGSWKGQKTGIVYMEATNEYIFNFDSKEFGGKASNYATKRKSPQDIFQAALLDKDITVTYKDEDGKEHVDQEATDAARDKVAELRDAFEDWVPQNQERVQQLTDTYNSVFNRHVLPTYNGQHLKIVGLQGMTLRPHQKDAVWRIINQRGGIIDHIVGAGKSLVMQASIMEMRRMGIAKKPMILALKSTTQQIATEFHQAFPAARVLAPTEDDFSVKNRKRFLAQIAVNDYDCIILSHEQYSALDHTDHIKRSFIEDQISQLDNLLEYLYGQKEQTQLTKKQAKGLEKRKENLKEKLKNLDLIRTDEEFVFENLGVDYLFVDECQAFKNLMFQTSYRNIAGLGTPEGSERSTKLLYGVRALQEMHQGDMGTVFLSGTTITNSLSELYNIFNYLRPNEMARMGLNTFDAWASTFAVRSTEAEFGVTNELKEKSRFRKFEGLQELSRLYTEIADVRNDNNLELPKPKLHTVFVPIPISDTMKRINDAITTMVRENNGKFFGIDPVRKDKYPWSLSATNLAKQATLSPKLIDTKYDDENGKIFHVCENIAKIYKQFDAQKGVQLIFCDTGVPTPGKKYDAYTDIIKRLTKDYGIPRSEIVDIHEANSDEKRQELFRKVNDGKVRILIGGTKNMGTGVNVQKRVVAMHHLDIPWTPADVNQRNGRGSRQGNEIARDYNNNQVDAYYYAVERTLDTYRYQLQDVKGKMIDNFKMANVGVDEFDEGSDEMSPAEMVAVLSGNPVILDKAKQDKLVDKLKRAQRFSLTEYARRRAEYDAMLQSQSNMEGLIRRNQEDIETLKRNGFVQDAQGNWPPLKVTLTEYERTTSGTTYDKATDAGKAIHERIKKTGTAYLHAYGISARVVSKVDDSGQTTLSKELEAITYSGIKYSVALSDDDTAAGQAMQNLLKKIYSNGESYKRRLEEINHKLDGADPGEYSFPRQAELDAAVAKKREIDAEYNKLVVSDKKPKKTEEEPEKQLLNLEYDAELTDAQQLATSALIEALNDNTDLDVFLATDEEATNALKDDNVERSTDIQARVATDIWNKYQYEGELESTRDIAEYVEANMPKNAETQPLFDAIDKWRVEEEEDRLLYGERGDMEPFEDAILNEVERLMKMGNAQETMQTTDGTLYGWAVGDRIYLTKDGLNPNTPIHEYTHLWAKAMRRNNREGWQSIVNIFKDTPMWDEVKADPNYAGLTTDDAICSEVLARYSGTRGAARMEEDAAEMLDEAQQSGSVLGMAKARRLINRVRKALSDFWNWVGTNLFGIKHFDSAEQVADRVLFDMLSGTELDLTAEQEMQHIKERAMADGTFMQAPNGKRTNLTERQWLQVRTRAFKRWFGDWELAAKVVNIIPAEKEHGFAGWDDARKWAKANIRGTYINPEIGDVTISGDAIDKYMSGKARKKSVSEDIHYAALKVLPSIIEESITGEIHEDRNNDANVRDIVRLFGCISIDGVPYRVKTTVKRYVHDNEKTKAYSYEVTEIELLEGTAGDDRNPLLRTTNNSITTAKLLKNIESSKYSGKKLLDFSQIVDENGEPRVVEHSTPNMFTTFDASRRGNNSGDMGVFGAGFYFGDMGTTGLYGKNQLNVFLNSKSPMMLWDYMPNDIASFIADNFDTPTLRKLVLRYDGKEMTVGEYIDIVKNVDDEMSRGVHNDEIERNSAFYHPNKLRRYVRDSVIGQRSFLIPSSLNYLINTMIGSEAFSGALKKEGHDGIVIGKGNNVSEYVVFDSNQIKSATDNNGEFSTENDDIEMMISGYTPEKLKLISDWNQTHPRPQYRYGETLKAYEKRLSDWETERAKFRAQLKEGMPSISEVEKEDRPISDGAPAFVEGVRPTPMANETPGEYALRLRQYYQLMRDNKLVAEYIAEINAQADAAAKVLKKNTLVRGLFDAAKPIENFQEWMKERGASVKNESNAYTDTFLATGRVTQANEKMERDIIRPLAKQIGKIIAPDPKTGKSRLDDMGVVWSNMDLRGTGTNLDGKELTPRELIGVYAQAKDCQEAIDLGLPDRGAAGFENNLGRSHEDIINMVESVIPKAELDELWRLINKATHFALNYDYESGRISEDTHTQFYQREFYVPQRGWRERDESGLVSEYEPVGKRGNDPYNAALVKAHGRKTLASDPFAYIMSIDASSIISSENNKIKQKFLQFCLDNENLGLKTGAFRVKKYWIMNVIDPETSKVKLDEEGNPMMTVSYVAPSAEDMEHDRTVKDLIKQKRKELAKVNRAFAERNEHGELGPQLEEAYKSKIAKIEQTIDDLEKQMRIAWHATNSHITQRTSDEKKQHEVRVLKDGQEYVIELQDEKLANAINKKFKQHQEELFNTTERMRNATRFMSAMLTQYNPEFAASNFARDYQVALATLIAEHPELVKPFIKNFAACQPAVWQYAFNDKVKDREAFEDSDLGRYLKEYYEAGAATGFSYMQDLKSLRRDFDAMIDESDFRRGIKGAVGVFSMLTEVSETAVRFAGYVSARQAGMGVNDAAYLSKELTTNFDRAGEIADSGWMSWFSFFRATLNGNIKFLKALKKMPLAYSLIAASYFAMGMLNQWLNPDDPDDEILASDYTRQSNFVIWKFRIPTAHFLRMFFAAGVNAAKWLKSEKSFGEATYNTATFATQELLPNYLNVLGNGTEWNNREGRVDFTWEGLLQGVMPSPVSPIADVYFNRDFRGATINREPFAKSQEGMKDILLAKERTLPVYKWLTQAIYEGVGGNMNTKFQSDDPAWRSWLFDTSASSVEHVVEGYMPAGMDLFITTAEAIYDAATGTPTGPDKWPFIRKFYNAYTPERAYMQQYYLLSGRVEDFKRNMDDYQKNDPARYRMLRNSQEYRLYLSTKKLVDNKKEQPNTNDVNALINANKQWLRKK